MSQPLFCFGNYDLNRYHTYPHSNGFSVDGREMVVIQMMPEQTSLWMLPMDQLGHQPDDTPAGRRIACFDILQPPLDQKRVCVFPDIALKKNIMAVAACNRVWLLDMDEPSPRPRAIYVAEGNVELFELVSVKPDGSKVCFGVRDRPSGICRCLEVDVASGAVDCILQKDWFATHFHYCPHNPDWVGYCHEGLTTEIPDRVQAMHPVHMPQGECIFDQQSDTPGKLLCVGHERWCYHETSALAIAYPISPAGPRGLYRISPDPSEPARVVSKSDRDWHCNISRDGKHMVIDTKGPLCDVVYVDPQTGKRKPLVTAKARNHPWHPHPAFSPDGRWVFFNDYNGNDAAPRGRVGCVGVDD